MTNVQVFCTGPKSENKFKTRYLFKVTLFIIIIIIIIFIILIVIIIVL